MKIRLGFKTPDVVEYAVREAVEQEMAKVKDGHEDDVDADDLKYEAEQACKKFVKYGECITVEVDTDTGEAKVLPA